MTNFLEQEPTIGKSLYAKNAVKYIDILNKLRRMGAQSAVDLPTVVFCGNQSAGKSSLLEAISGIQLPRSDGTCTRCVMEIRLTESSEDWSCQVSLRNEYDSNEEKLIQPKETKFGDIITKKDDVELAARRAQKALLNPKHDPEKYFEWDFEELSYEHDASTNALKFTKNVVCLEIKGENVPNLSLIDLPGIIRTVEKEEDERFIKLIEELVEDYITKEKSIIVATVSCKDEIENQVILTLAKKADKEGIRTLGALTKPDTIERGTHGRWLEIMKGGAHKLELGYYVVKNPAPMELQEGISFENARKNEKKFFENEEPWKSFHLRDRLGVDHLQKKLSDLLINAIRRNLPSIKKEIEDKLENIRAELELIPDQISDNPRVELFRMIKSCTNHIREETTCSNDQTDLWQAINKEFRDFKYNLCSKRPTFEIGLTASSSYPTYSKTASKFDVLNEFLETTTETPAEQKDEKEELIVVTEGDIINNINKSRGRLLPGFIPYSATVNFILEHQRKWKSPTLECLYKINEIMTRLVNDSTDKTFLRFPELVGRMKLNAMTCLDECKQKTEKYIGFLNDMEGSNFPFTLDEGSMITSKTEYLLKLHEAVKNEGREPTEALEIVAFVMAYFKLSFKRYADNVSMTIIHAFIDNFSKAIEEKLIIACEPMEGEENFDVNELIKEDENISKKRENLIETEKHLHTMLSSLVLFGC